MVTLDIVVDEDREDSQPDDMSQFREFIQMKQGFEVDVIQSTDTSWTIAVDDLDARIILDAADDFRLFAEIM